MKMVARRVGGKGLGHQVEKEYQELYLEIKETFDENNTIQERAEHSIKLAEASGVEDNKIMRNHKQLDDFFS